MLPRPVADPPGVRPRPSPVLPPPGRAGARVGRWRLTDRLGPGTFAAIDSTIAEEVVVKVAASGDPAAARLRAEIAALRSLGGGGHPALVVAAGELDDGEIVAVATRRVAGTGLDAVLREAGTLAYADAARILAPVASALAEVHRRGWVHGDVSPANVVVTDEGGVLVDLGSARPALGVALVGATPATAAPEVRAGRPPSAASDVWSLAALVAVAVTGEPPTTGSPLPAPVALALGRALAHDPAARPSAAEVADALAAAGRTGVVPAPLPPRTVASNERTTIDFGPRPVRAIAPVEPSTHRRRSPAVAAALLLAAAIGWELGRPSAEPTAARPSGPAAAVAGSPCPPVAPLAGAALEADVDGDGCTDAAGWHHGVLTVRTARGDLRRYAIAEPTAEVSVGDWDGDGVATPAITDPSTGVVTRYDDWPSRGG